MIKVNAKPVLVKPKKRRIIRGQKRISKQALKAQIYDILPELSTEEILEMLRYLKQVKSPYIDLGTADKRKFYELVLYFDATKVEDVKDFLSHFGLNLIEVMEMSKTNRIIRVQKKEYRYLKLLYQIYGSSAHELAQSFKEVKDRRK